MSDIPATDNTTNVPEGRVDHFPLAYTSMNAIIWKPHLPLTDTSHFSRSTWPTAPYRDAIPGETDDKLDEYTVTRMARPLPNILPEALIDTHLKYAAWKFFQTQGVYPEDDSPLQGIFEEAFIGECGGINHEYNAWVNNRCFVYVLFLLYDKLKIKIQGVDFLNIKDLYERADWDSGLQMTSDFKKLYNAAIKFKKDNPGLQTKFQVPDLFIHEPSVEEALLRIGTPRVEKFGERIVNIAPWLDERYQFNIE